MYDISTWIQKEGDPLRGCRGKSETRVTAYGFALSYSEGEVRMVWKWWKSFLRHCQPPPLPSTVSSSSASRGHIFPLRRHAYRRTWGPLSILILLFHSASSVFRASPSSFFPLLFSLSLVRPNRAIRAREFDLPVSPHPYPLAKTTFRSSLSSGLIYPPPSPAPSTFRSTITYGSIGYER